MIPNTQYETIIDEETRTAHVRCQAFGADNPYGHICSLIQLPKLHSDRALRNATLFKAMLLCSLSCLDRDTAAFVQTQIAARAIPAVAADTQRLFAFKHDGLTLHSSLNLPQLKQGAATVPLVLWCAV